MKEGFIAYVNLQGHFRTKEEAFAFASRFCDHSLVHSVVVEPMEYVNSFRFDDFDVKVGDINRLLANNPDEVFCKNGEVK